MEVELNIKPLSFSLKDKEYEIVDKTREFRDRPVVRAICIDENKNYLFAHVDRNDRFGCLEHLETSGGGIEKDESDEEAIKRELEEELGVKIEILAYLGEVRNDYNLLYTTNVNHYYLVRKIGECPRHLTEGEKHHLHLEKIVLDYESVKTSYLNMRKHRLGRMLYDKEMPFIELANSIVNKL